MLGKRADYGIKAQAATYPRLPLLALDLYSTALSQLSRTAPMADSAYIVDVTQTDFASKVLAASQQVPVLVDFWASWCAPCQMLMPILSKLADEYQGRFLLAKVNTDEQQALAVQNGVRSLPTVRIYKQGRVVDEFMGAQPEAAIRAMLEKHLDKPSGGLLDQARQAADMGQIDQALALLDQARQEDPENGQITLEQAHLMILTGDFEQAEALLQALPVDLQGSDESKQLAAEIRFGRIALSSPEETELEQRLASQPDDLMARYQLAARLILMGEYEPAMEHLFQIMRKNRKFEDDAGRRGLVAVFDLLGRHELVTHYRAKMLNALH